MFQHHKNTPVIQASSRAAADRSTHIGLSQPAVQRVVQRQALTKIIGEWHDTDYYVDDVIIGGRTISPFSNTMGAHSTAWVAHIDAIRRHFVGTTISEGIDWFLTTIEDDLDSPLRKLDGYLGKEQWAKLDFATYQLKVSRDDLTRVSAHITEQNYQNTVQVLRIAINAYLSYINLLPTSTVAGGDPSGHGEGVARGEINYFEFAASKKYQKEEGNPSNTGLLETYTPLEDGDFDTEHFTGIDTELRKLLKGNLKDQELADYKKIVRGTLWTMFAEETPEVFAQGHENTQKKEVKEEIWALALQNFLRTIRVAYPFAYDFCKMNDTALLTTDVLLKTPALDVAHIVKLVNGEAQFVNIAGSYNFKETKDKDKVNAELSGSHQLNESEVRANAFGHSDIVGGGSGLQVTVLLNDVNSIGDIIMTGRTKSPFSGTMGAHTTAWAVHQDAVINRLTGLPLSKALLQLSLMTQEAMKSPQLEFAGVIDEKHQISLVGAFNEARRYVAMVGGKYKQDTGVKTAFLENFIGTYLHLVNVTPLATIAKGGVPGGRREGEHRQFLKRYEAEGDTIITPKQLEAKTKEQIITDHLIGMFDQGGLSYFPPTLGSREPTNISAYVTDGFDDKHSLWNFVKDKGRYKANQKKKKYALDQFLHTVAEAYPRSLKNSNLVTALSQKHTVELEAPESPKNVIGHYVMVVGNKNDPNAQLNKGYRGEIREINYYGISVLLHASFKTVVLQPDSIKFV